ncbi:methyltransferase family protein [Herbihabitans rhizosphaerae]|uniref:Methyltransferase family protein n=1 Tax=Herbihabitans rhizosphaerae TaxID=1872711 RepID=A0A4Q7KJS0_9PSEU|nr:methyltransferase domain-containing protein [Herbihabitans rhizosphaerae]RZS36828.1 methyltransferase family protein [Herbihabitans rhizosphaerae]
MTSGTDRVSFHANEIREQDTERLAFILDMQAALDGVRRLRDWAMDGLAVRPGERVVDVGSGTGECTQRFATEVGTDGEALGIEPNPAMRALAEKRAAEAGSVARFVDGDAYALPFEDASVDVLRCERVFQHLDEPQRAADEFARVLRPGGRVVLIDSDWATAILHPGDPEVAKVVVSGMIGVNRSNPLSGRRLPGQLTAAGLTVTDIGSQALVQPQEAAAGPLTQMLGAAAVDNGWITDEQRHTLVADLAAAGERGDFFLSVTMFGVLAVKP